MSTVQLPTARALASGRMTHHFAWQMGTLVVMTTILVLFSAGIAAVEVPAPRYLVLGTWYGLQSTISS